LDRRFYHGGVGQLTAQGPQRAKPRSAAAARRVVLFGNAFFEAAPMTPEPLPLIKVTSGIAAFAAIPTIQVESNSTFY
jgi:hypothetical protein